MKTSRNPRYIMAAKWKNKKVRIFHFKTRHQERLRFVRILKEYIEGIGLKKAKELQDQMLDGVPIECSIDSKNLSSFVQELKELDMGFEFYSE